MVHRVLVFATAALGLASRIKLEDAEDLVAEVKDQDENAATLETEFEEEESVDQVPRRCEQRTTTARRRGSNLIDCGCNAQGSGEWPQECFPDDPNDQCMYVYQHQDSTWTCRRRRAAPTQPPPPRPPPGPPPPPPPPPVYTDCGPRCWEHGSHRDSGSANSPGHLPNGWVDPNSEMMLPNVPGHAGEPYDPAAFVGVVARDPHHCFSGWVACCNTEHNCCANCPVQDVVHPEWGPIGFRQCLGWFPQCGTNHPPPANLPQSGMAAAREAISNTAHRVGAGVGNGARRASAAASNFWSNHHDEGGFHWR